MKSQEKWFAEYAVSHQNTLNQAIHYICVPVIYFSIIGMLMSVDTSLLQKIVPFNNRVFVNWATVVVLFLLVFYWNLSFKTF